MLVSLGAHGRLLQGHGPQARQFPELATLVSGEDEGRGQ